MYEYTKENNPLITGTHMYRDTKVNHQIKIYTIYGRVRANYTRNQYQDNPKETN